MRTGRMPGSCISLHQCQNAVSATARKTSCQQCTVMCKSAELAVPAAAGLMACASKKKNLQQVLDSIDS